MHGYTNKIIAFTEFSYIVCNHIKNPQTSILPNQKTDTAPNMNRDNHNQQQLPLKQWKTDMEAAVDSVCSQGLNLLEVHSEASDKAKESAREWKLGERQDKKRDTLLQLLDATVCVIEKLDTAMQSLSPLEMKTASRVIREKLPEIEERYLFIRHTSLDLLRWARRAGKIEDSTLPADYRASYAKLTSYAPIFKPRLESFQYQLLELCRDPDSGAEARELLSAITRFNGLMDSERSFVQAIVAPPLELVFQETQLFVDDWNNYSADERSTIATRLNDCCQFLLYDPAEFDRRTEEVRPQLVDGLDASMYSLTVGKNQLLFSVDEDPVFEQLTVTLYRVMAAEHFDEACQLVFEKIYSDLR